MKLALFLMALLLVSCGESPLLNHDVETGFSGREASFAINENRFNKSGISFTVDWHEPPRTGEAKFLLRIWKTNTGTINGPYVDPKENLHIFLWMPSMGHGSAPVKVTRKASGEFEVTNVFFIMGGEWEVKFQLLSGGKVSDETVITLNL